MKKNVSLRLVALAAVSSLAVFSLGCPTGPKTCKLNTDCPNGQVCSAAGTCQTGIGGGTGGGTVGGGTGGSGGGTAGGSGGGTGGGASGGTGGGSASGGETCANASVITPPAAGLAGTTIGAANDVAADCTNYINAGPDKVYQVTVPAGQRVRATVTPEIADAGDPDAGVRQYDPAIYLVQAPPSNCTLTDPDGGTAVVCLAADDTGSATKVNTVNWSNGGTSPVDVYVVIDSSVDPTSTSVTDQGNYTLDVVVDTPPAGDKCDTAMTIVSGTPLLAQDLTSFGNDYTRNTSCSGGSGADRAYQIDVPVGQQLTVTVTPVDGGTLDPTLAFADHAQSCGTTCLAATDVGFSGDPENLAWTNRGTATSTIFIVVDAYSSSGTGTFDIAATVALPPVGDTCQTATSLASPLTGQSTIGYANDYQNGTGSAGCASNSIGSDRAYTLQVPAGQRAKVTVTPSPLDGGFAPSVSFVAAPAATCDASPRACLAGANSPGSGQRTVASFYNTDTAAKDLFVIVDSSAGNRGNFDISAATAVPAANDTCTTASATLTAGTLAGQNLTGFELDYGSGNATCPSLAFADRIYKVTVPPGQRVETVVTPTTATDAGFDPVLEFINATAAVCDSSARACASFAYSSAPGQPASLAWANAGDAGVSLFVVVGSGSANPSDTAYGVTTTLGAVPAGEWCTNPTSLGSGTLTGQSLASFSHDYDMTDPSCSAYSPDPTHYGPDRVYTIDIPASKSLNVTITPTGGADAGAATEDPVLTLLELPASNCNGVGVCVSNADLGSGGDPETLTYANGTAAVKTVLLVVGNYQSAGMLYTLDVQFQ